MMFLKKMIKGKPTGAMIDTSASHNFVLVEKKNLLGLNMTKE